VVLDVVDEAARELRKVGVLPEEGVARLEVRLIA
jgi:hypothetical protein